MVCAVWSAAPQTVVEADAFRARNEQRRIRNRHVNGHGVDVVVAVEIVTLPWTSYLPESQQG